MPYIYKITNTINNKVYIGQTSLTPEIRFNKHKRCYKSNCCSKLYKAMRKYGKENFIIETICETNVPNEDEKYWIQYYNSVKEGYNITYGGEGGSSLGTEEELKVIECYKLFKSIHKVNKQLGYSREYIRNILKKYHVKYDNINNSKNINEKLIIDTYNQEKQITTVSKILNISERTIRKYLRKNNIEIYNHKNDKFIYIACDIETKEEIKKFLNIIDNNICQCIDRVINGKRKSYKGYYWKKILKT